MSEGMDTLLDHLPKGDVTYVHERDGSWGVAIFEAGAAHRFLTLATGMDKNVAAWVAHKLREVRRS